MALATSSGRDQVSSSDELLVMWENIQHEWKNNAKVTLSIAETSRTTTEIRGQICHEETNTNIDDPLTLITKMCNIINNDTDSQGKDRVENTGPSANSPPPFSHSHYRDMDLSLRTTEGVQIRSTPSPSPSPIITPAPSTSLPGPPPTSQLVWLHQTQQSNGGSPRNFPSPTLPTALPRASGLCLGSPDCALSSRPEGVTSAELIPSATTSETFFSLSMGKPDVIIPSSSPTILAESTRLPHPAPSFSNPPLSTPSYTTHSAFTFAFPPRERIPPSSNHTTSHPITPSSTHASSRLPPHPHANFPPVTSHRLHTHLHPHNYHQHLHPYPHHNHRLNPHAHPHPHPYHHPHLQTTHKPHPNPQPGLAPDAWHRFLGSAPPFCEAGQGAGSASGQSLAGPFGEKRRVTDQQDPDDGKKKARRSKTSAGLTTVTPRGLSVRK